MLPGARIALDVGRYEHHAAKRSEPSGFCEGVRPTSSGRPHQGVEGGDGGLDADFERFLVEAE